MTMSEVSALGPVDPASLQDDGQEKAAPWIVRKLVGVRCIHLSFRDTNVLTRDGGSSR